MNKHLAFFVLLFALAALYAPPIAAQPDTVKTILMAQKWHMVEALAKAGDTVTDIRTITITCEKDNYLKYETGDLYHIYDVGDVCKGTGELTKGTWEYVPAKRVLVDVIDQGKPVDKTILELNSQMLKLQYVAENGQVVTTTYYSDAVLNSPEKKEEAMQEVVDNSDPANYITRLVWDKLARTHWFVLLNKAQMNEGPAKDAGTNYGLVRKVAVLPFTKNTVINDKELTAKGVTAGVDFIVTGNVVNASTEKNSEGDLVAKIEYSVLVIDVKRGRTISNQTFVHPTAKEEKKKKFLTVLGDGADAVLGSAGDIVAAGGWLGGWSYGEMMLAYVGTEAAAGSVSSFSSIYTAKNVDGERKAEYEKNYTIIAGINNTAKDMGQALYESLPLRVPVMKVDGELAIIECGQDMGVWPGMEVSIVKRDAMTTSDGKVLYNYESLEKITVTSTGEFTKCKVKKSSSLGEQFGANKQNIFAEIVFTEPTTAKK